MREIKFKYYFDNHAPAIFSLRGLEAGCLLEALWRGAGKVIASEQFTGLLDRNGTEIYEGDIVLTERGTARQITWDQGTMQPFGSYFDQFDEWEVIGNIHQNPELLKCMEY